MGLGETFGDGRDAGGAEGVELPPPHRGDPDRAVAAEGDGADAADLGGEPEHRPSVVGEGLGNAGPDVSAGTDANIAQGVHQERAGGLRPHLLRVASADADQPVRKRDPDPAARIFPDRPLTRQHRYEGATAELADGIGRADPGLARVIDGDGGEVEGEPAGRQGDPLQAPLRASAAPPEGVAGPHPESAGAVEEDRLDGGGDLQPRLFAQPAPLDPEDPSRTAGPEGAGAVGLEQGVDRRAGLLERAFGAARHGSRTGGEDAVGEADEMALLGAGPERAVAPFRQVEDPVAPQRRQPFAVERLEVGAVEAHQAVEGGQPEEAIARLEDLGDPRRRQAVTGGEDLVHEARSVRQAAERARVDGTSWEAECCDPEERGGARSLGHCEERMG